MATHIIETPQGTLKIWQSRRCGWAWRLVTSGLVVGGNCHFATGDDALAAAEKFLAIRDNLRKQGNKCQ